MNHDTSTYLMHHGVKGMRWGVRRKQKKQAKADARKAGLIESAKKYAKTEKAISEDYKRQADRISKMSTRDYIKEITGHDIKSSSGRKAYKDEYGIDPKAHHKSDVDHYRERQRASYYDSKEYDKLAKEYGQMNVEGLSSREVIQKGQSIMQKHGISPYYRLR